MKTVLITGAGRGLGQAIIEAYSKEGFFVVATDFDTNLLDDLHRKKNCLPLNMDVTSETSVKICSETIKKEVDQIDVLVSNAGIFDFYPVSEAGADKLKKIFDVNVYGLANLTKYFLPLLSPTEGRLIVVSSESYKVPSPFQPYSVSKQALESLYKSIKIELALKGIKSVLIRPGAMQTKILDDTINFKTTGNKSYFSEEFSGFIATVPKYIGRIADPEKIAKTILKAGVTKHPKAIYHINHNPVVSLLSILPQTIMNMIIRRSLIKDDLH